MHYRLFLENDIKQYHESFKNFNREDTISEASIIIKKLIKDHIFADKMTQLWFILQKKCTMNVSLLGISMKFTRKNKRRRK